VHERIKTVKNHSTRAGKNARAEIRKKKPPKKLGGKENLSWSEVKRKNEAADGKRRLLKYNAKIRVGMGCG